MGLSGTGTLVVVRLKYRFSPDFIVCSRNTPSVDDSSFVFTTYNGPPESAANRATRSSNSSSNKDSSSSGRAPITGGSNASRYERNISASKVTTGAVSAGMSPLPLVVKGVSISSRRVDGTESAMDLIDFLLDLELALPQIAESIPSRCREGVRRWFVK